MTTSQPLFHLNDDGLRLQRQGGVLVDSAPDWLEVAFSSEIVKPRFHPLPDGGVGARAGDIAIQAHLEEEAGSPPAWRRLFITVVNQGPVPRELNLKWTLTLAQPQGRVRWLIPGLFYKENQQQYDGGLPSVAGTPDLAKSRWPHWTFRADLMAVPMVMAWTESGSVALVMEERQQGRMVGLGLDHRDGAQALIGCWPFREEPRPRNTIAVDRDLTQPVITYATLAPSETVALECWLYLGDRDAYAFAPVLRETFRRWDDRHALHPWYPTSEAATHAAHGLFTWHFDREVGALWETCAYDRYYAKNDRLVDRFEMHTGFVSGTPYAYALRRYGLSANRPELAEAGRRVIDLCCRHLTPFGTFYARLVKDQGWTAGWPAPQRTLGQPNLGSGSGELQARTLAEATLFAARAALAEPVDSPDRSLWGQAVRSNLDFVLAHQRPDGNPGQAYALIDGRVLDWDGEEGLLWIAALVEGSRLLAEHKYLAAAMQAGRFYQPAVEAADITGAPEGMHLLPTSEDPQNALLSYTLLWEATGDRAWQRLARLAAELLMTFRWQYNTQFDAMTLLGRYDYRTKGLDVSSPNNVCLHPYGLIVIPELVRLWEDTGDPYLLKQARNNLLGCHQMLSPADGVFDAPRGMMTERWHQTPNGIAKGGTLPLSHSWAIGLVLYADLFTAAYGQILVDGETGEAVALEALTLTRQEGDAWLVTNPWDRELALTVAVRSACGCLAWDAEIHSHAEATLFRLPVRLPAYGTARLRWEPERTDRQAASAPGVCA
jgi:hypothetical protein